MEPGFGAKGDFLSSLGVHVNLLYNAEELSNDRSFWGFLDKWGTTPPRLSGARQSGGLRGLPEEEGCRGHRSKVNKTDGVYEAGVAVRNGAREVAHVLFKPN